MAATAELKCIDVHLFLTKQGTNSNEMWFCGFCSAVCTCLYDKLMHSCFLPTSYAVCHWALQNVILMWMDSDGTCGFHLIDELFIIENYTFCKQNAF